MDNNNNHCSNTAFWYKPFSWCSKKIGRLVGEYSNAKNQIENEMKGVTNENLQVSGPVKDERKKLEMMANQLEIEYEHKTDV